MSRLIQALALWIGVLTLPCVAAYDSMPTPPPNATDDATKPRYEKARVKRGTHWYRSPAKETAPSQLEWAYQLYAKAKYRRAANAYQALVYAWPDSPEAPKAQLALAQVQETRGNYLQAFDEYQYLFDYYPGQFDYQKALERQFKIANYLMTTPKGAFLFFRGFDAPERALPLFESILRNAPEWERAPLTQLNIGIIHEKNEEEDEAVVAYEVLQNRYNDPALVAEAAYREAYCLYKIYRNHPNNENACNAARAGLVQYITAFPRHEKVPEARTYLQALNNEQAGRAFEQARYYDTIARRPKAALIAYKEYLERYAEMNPDLAAIARTRVDALTKETSHEKK